MEHNFRKRVLLAGVSALAIMLGAGGAHPETIAFTGAEVTWTVPVTGLYDLTAYGARGGGRGGYGAEVGGDIELSAGTVLSVVVGGRGATAGANFGGGGGGGSFVFEGSSLLVAAGGGGGHGVYGTSGGPGLTTTSGGQGYETPSTPGYAALFAGGQGGTGGQGGGVGSRSATKQNGGGGGAGVYGGGASGIVGNAGQGAPSILSHGAGSGALNGGFGGGGGGGFNGGGGGGGYSGGGGGEGYTEDVYSGGGGGGSFLAQAFADPVMVAGEHIGDGSVTIALISTPPPAAPEPSTWAMALAGFASLGWLARMRGRRKVTSA